MMRYLLVALTALSLAAAATAVRGFPPPREHDEYSYILGAETFLSGRLTNPPHPMWRHFDSFHVLQQPTYNSKYPPANALMIAAGWRLTGHPIAGVWLGFAFMCVAIFWMLRAWIGPKLGLYVTLAFTSWIAISYWSWSYWGGTVAAGAAALVLGAAHRIVTRRPTLAAPITLGVGLIVLANSRPFEGLLLSLAVGVVLLRWLFRNRDSTLPWKMRHVVAPVAAVGLVGVLCMGTYNHAVTGHWLQMPYTAYQQQRGGAPLFVWQPTVLRPVSPDPTVRAYMKWEDSTYRAATTLPGRVEFLQSFVNDFVKLIIPGMLLLPFLLVPVVMRDRWNRFAVLATVTTVGGMALCAYFNPHYAAPLTGLLLALYGGCLRWLARLHTGRVRAGRWLTAAILALWFGFGVWDTASLYLQAAPALAAGVVPLYWTSQRQLIADTLAAHGKRNLVIVRYGPEHGSGDEWVYNAANVDASPVVWAHDLGDRDNRELLDYYRDRAVWLVDVSEDAGPYTIRPYPPQAP